MYVVILAGGSGTRFWPLSRSAMPKQLISITGDRSMLQKTVERVLPLEPEKIIIVTNHLQSDETARQMQLYPSCSIEIISEPIGRNTAPAIAIAAAIIAADDPNGVMVVLPADHFIKNEPKLRETLKIAADGAGEGYLVTLGITPSRPETGYGYIESGSPVHPDGKLLRVKRFVEKPPIEKALLYLEEGNYYWNSGMFVWQAGTILAEIESNMPDLYHALQREMGTSDGGYTADALKERISSLYSKISGVSIDYGVMEKSSNVLMVPVEMGWSDVGSWSALPEVVPPDANGNVCVNASGQINIDSTDCLIYADRRFVSTVGVHNLVVVSTPDAIMICDRERCQDVKKIVELLGERGFTSLL